MKFLLAAVLVSFTLSAQAIGTKEYGLDFGRTTIDSDIKMAMQDAKEAGNYILLDVGATWCSWCKKLDQQVAKLPVVQKKFNEAFTIVKVDGDHSGEFLSQYPKAPYYPFFIVLTAEGELVEAMSPHTFLKKRNFDGQLMQEFIAKYQP